MERTTCSSRVNERIASAESPLQARAQKRTANLASLIAEIGDGSGKPAVLCEVGVAQHFKRESEGHRFTQGPALKHPDANQLARHLHEHAVVACFQEFHTRDLRLLMQLLGLPFRRFFFKLPAGL